MKKWILVSVLSAVGCGTRLSPDDRARLLESREARIDDLAVACGPASWAARVEIAAGSYAWNDPLAAENVDASMRAIEHETRCRAMNRLSGIGAELSPKTNWAVIDRYAERLDRPELRGAVMKMLLDSEPWCSKDGEQTFLSPRDAVDSIVGVVPFASFRSTFEAVGDERGLARLRRTEAEPRPSVRAARIDALVADATPDAFERLLSVLAPDFRWEDGLAPPSGREALEIRNHVVGGLLWLDHVLYQDGRRCAVILQRSVAEGALGETIVQRLDHRDPEIRVELLRVLQEWPRPDARARLEELASSDPDEDVRREARGAVWYMDRGGAQEVFRRQDLEYRRQHPQ